jgi:CRP-like cAMP-binding protein
MAASVDDLRSIPLFAHLEPDALERLAEVAADVEAQPDQVLVEPLQAGTGMYFVVEGTVEVEAREGWTELGPGNFFGELALLTDDGRRTARCRAKTNVRCLAFSRAAFEDLVRQHPDIAATLLETALGRLG